MVVGTVLVPRRGILLVVPEAFYGHALYFWEAGEFGEGGMNISGRLHADLKPVAGVILVYLSVHGADVDVVAPEDIERG